MPAFVTFRCFSFSFPRLRCCCARHCGGRRGWPLPPAATNRPRFPWCPGRNQCERPWLPGLGRQCADRLRGRRSVAVGQSAQRRTLDDHRRSLQVAAVPPHAGDIVLQVDRQMKDEQYTLTVADRAVVCGGSYRRWPGGRSDAAASGGRRRQRPGEPARHGAGGRTRRGIPGTVDRLRPGNGIRPRSSRR